jgi:hypothetical protein
MACLPVLRRTGCVPGCRGKDKFENEGLIAYGWPEDVWCVSLPCRALGVVLRAAAIVNQNVPD